MPFFTGISRSIGGAGFGNSFRRFFTTGGIKYTSGAYTIHKFIITDSNPFGQPGSTASYTFSWDGNAPAPFSNADILIVAGGGSGGSGGHYGGGGGAGGYTYISGFNIASLGKNISVTVGKGGRGSGLGGPENGDPSSFGSVTSYGGGRGGSSGYGSAGGSTGGWGTYFQGGATNYGGQGAGPGGNHPNSIANAGGGARNEGISNRGGGGGGAGGAGNYGDNYPGASPTDGSGGPGLSNSIDGTNITYAAGGGSGASNTYILDRGNGGDGFSSGGTPFANAGSPGIVIVRYLT
jgi:hypothetical protein